MLKDELKMLKKFFYHFFANKTIITVYNVVCLFWTFKISEVSEEICLDLDKIAFIK